jgi:hypothetical protein
MEGIRGYKIQILHHASSILLLWKTKDVIQYKKLVFRVGGIRIQILYTGTKDFTSCAN